MLVVAFAAAFAAVPMVFVHLITTPPASGGA